LLPNSTTSAASPESRKRGSLCMELPQLADS
jgi:hypothetical protein